MQTNLDAMSISPGQVPASKGRLLVVSNRGPVEYTVDDDGDLQKRSAGGGLATALTCVAKSKPVTWIASAGTPADRLAASAGPTNLGEDRRLRLVAPSPEAYSLFYASFCNPLLWFLQHSLWDQLQRPHPEAEAQLAWERGYLPVNQAFGEVVIEELSRDGGAGQVMLHDYHLYLAPRFIRQRVPGAVLQHFVHIPWPEPERWSVLPRAIVEAICQGLLANDSVVFQTQESAENFVRTCEAFLPDTRLEGDGGTILYLGRRTRVWLNPVSVDVTDLRARLSSEEARAYRDKLAADAGERTIVRVDRLDPTKNVLGGFQAFDLLIERHPEWEGRVRFLAFLVPSRTAIPEYLAYREEVLSLVEGINARRGRPGWTPITVYHEHNRLQALAAMSLYDVLLVNPLRDGMNLVSKEGPVVNGRDGVLVLSVTTGSYVELGDGALAVQPEDIEGTAEALHQALSLPETERRERARLLRQAVLRHDLNHWLRLLLDDLNAIERSRSLAREAPVSSDGRAASRAV